MDDESEDTVIQYYTDDRQLLIALIDRQPDTRRKIAMTFGTEKLEWYGYAMVKKFLRYIYSFRQGPRT